MDPNTNLKEQRDAAAFIIDRIDAGNGEGIDRDTVVDTAERLAELVLALDEWLSRDGFLPRRWERPNLGFEKIQRFFIDDRGPRTWNCTVEDVMNENAGYEDSGWRYLSDAVEEGFYDDSDWSSGIASFYAVDVDDRREVVAQMREWAEAFLAGDGKDDYDASDFALPRY